MTPILCGFILLSMSVMSVSAFEAFTMTSGFLNPPYIGFRHMITGIGSPDVVQELGTYRITSPGVYSFSFTALSDLKGLRVSIRRNRVPIVTGFADDKGGYKSVTLNAVLRLARGDAVYCFIEEGSIYESPLHSQGFSGDACNSVGIDNFLVIEDLRSLKPKRPEKKPFTRRLGGEPSKFLFGNSSIRAFTSFSGYLIQADSRSMFGLLGRSANDTESAYYNEIDSMEIDKEDKIFVLLKEKVTKKKN